MPRAAEAFISKQKEHEQNFSEFPLPRAKTIEMVHSNSHPKNIIYMFLMNFPINTWTSDLAGSTVQLPVPDQTVKE